MKKYLIMSVLVFTFIFSGVSFASANTDASVLQNLVNQIEAIRGQLAGLAARSATTIQQSATVRSIDVTGSPLDPENLQDDKVTTPATTVTTKTQASFALPSVTQRPGTSGESVKQVQQALVKLGYLTEKQITGSYNEETKNAVASFQIKNNLGADGVAGAKTFAALRNSWGTSWGEAGYAKSGGVTPTIVTNPVVAKNVYSCKISGAGIFNGTYDVNIDSNQGVISGGSGKFSFQCTLK